MRTFLLSLAHVALGLVIGYMIAASRAPSRAAVEEKVIGMFAFPNASSAQPPGGPAGAQSTGASALLASAEFDAWSYPGSKTVTSAAAQQSTYHGPSGALRSDTGDIRVLETADPYEAVLGYYYDRTGRSGGAGWAKRAWRGGSGTEAKGGNDGVNSVQRASIFIGCPRPEDDGRLGEAYDPYVRCNVVAYRGNGFALTVVIQRCREDGRTYVVLIRDGVSIDRAAKSPD